MEKHVRQSIAIVEKEQDRYLWGCSLQYTRSDGWSESVMLSTAIFPKTAGTVTMAMKNYNYGLKKKAPRSSALVKQIHGQFDEITPGSYARYWHGYNVLLKPALLVMNLENVRILSFFVQLSLLMVLFVKLYEKLGIQGFVPMLFAMFVLNPLSNALCLQYFSVFVLTIGASLFILMRKKFDTACLFLIVGMCTSYFDLLTFPVVSLGLPLGLLYLLKSREEAVSVKDAVCLFLIACSAWGLGYAGMWFGKWLLASLLTDENVIMNALGQALFRVNGVVPWKPDQPVTFLSALQGNLHILDFMAMYCVMGLLALFILAGAVKNRSALGGQLHQHAGAIAGLFLTSLLTFVWYAVLKNHSFIHTFFTFRDLAVPVFALSACAMLVCFPVRGAKEKE